LNAKWILAELMFTLAIAPSAAMAQEAPAFLSQHETSVADRQAIEKLLDTYTTSVTNGDEAAFEALLLDDQVAFSGTYEFTKSGADGVRVVTQHYRRFRESIFASGKRYTQHFYNVHIDQDGILAQVSLDFITQETKTGRGGYGWKTIQLLKIRGHWKIASEFYTANALPAKPTPIS
jgi:hypothetical protein